MVANENNSLEIPAVVPIVSVESFTPNVDERPSDQWLLNESMGDEDILGWILSREALIIRKEKREIEADEFNLGFIWISEHIEKLRSERNLHPRP